MKCSRFCIEQPRPTRLILLGPPWSREIPYMPSGEPYSPPHHCSRLERPRSPGDEIKIVHPVTWRTPSHHHALAVQAAPRPLHDSLRATLASLEAAGLRRWPGPKFVMADGCQPDVPSPWQVFATMDGPPGLGSARTFLAAFRKALEIDPGLELLTIFEDDVALSRNALDYIQVVEMPADVAMISWYSWEWKPPGPLLPPFLGIQPSRFFFDSQGLTLSRRAIDAALYCPMAANWRYRNKKDIMMAWVLMDAPHAEHCPNLAQHMGGTNSACGNSVTNVSTTFLGTDFNALDLAI